MISRLRWTRRASRFRFGAMCGTVLLAGCAVGPTLDAASYDGEPTKIEIPCEEPFSVWENARQRRVKVSSTVMGELGRSFRGRECQDPQIGRLTRAERFYMVAREHLKRTDREACTISRTDLLSANSYEFRYNCAAAAGRRV